MSTGMKELKFSVSEQPIGKPRMTQRDKWKKRPAVVAYRQWCDIARLSVRARGGIPTDAVIESLSWTAWFRMPKSWTKKKKQEMAGQLHRSKPDRDNIDKAVLDALFKEDSGIAAGCLEKRGCREGEGPRLEVTLRFTREALSA